MFNTHSALSCPARCGFMCVSKKIVIGRDPKQVAAMSVLYNQSLCIMSLLHG